MQLHEATFAALLKIASDVSNFYRIRTYNLLNRKYTSSMTLKGKQVENVGYKANSDSNQDFDSNSIGLDVIELNECI